MEKYQLTKDDKLFVNNLMKIMGFIENVYTQLCEAEVSNIQDEYILSHIYDLLNDALNEQRIVMSYLKTNDSRINPIIDYISNKFDFHDSPLDDVCVSTMDTSNRDIKRAIALINDKRINYNMNKTNVDVIDKTLNGLIILKNSIDLDYFQGYLYFMQEYIDDQMDLIVRRKLIQCKYNLYYLNPRLESNLIERRFVVYDKPYYSSKMISDYLDLSDDFYYDTYYYEGCTNACENIDNIIKLKGEELEKDCVEILSYSAFVKSALLMMSPTSVNILEEETKKKLYNLSTHDFFKTANIYQIFDELADNRSKTLKISLRDS